MAKGKHYHNPILVENAFFGEYKKHCEGPIKVAHCKNKLSFGMDPHLDIPTTNEYGLQVGIITKGILYIHLLLHTLKHLHNTM
jgi:hypothetical protein